MVKRKTLATDLSKLVADVVADRPSNVGHGWACPTVLARARRSSLAGAA